MTRKLFISYETGAFRGEEIDVMLETFNEVVDDDIELCIIPDNIDPLSEQQVQEFVEELVEALDSDDE